MPGKCHFNELWLSDPKFKLWLKPVEKDIHSAFCILCKKRFDISKAGVYNLNLHTSGKRHQQLALPLRENKQQLLHFSSTSKASTSEETDSVPITTEQLNKPVSDPVKHTATNNFIGLSEGKKDITSYFLKDEVTKCEIYWTLHKVRHHSSSRAHAEATNLFPVMFSDSLIAKNMHLHKDKLCYIATFGLGPFFQSELENYLTHCPYLSVSFDETLNTVAQRSQMDILVRFWDASNNVVVTRYLTSCFIDKATAVNLMHSFLEALEFHKIPLKKVQNVSMDGPNVNLKMLRELKEHMKMNGNEENSELFDIGTCSLHSVHNAYKNAHNCTGWMIKEFLRSLYYLFKDSPSRRADYKYYSGSTKFPYKFCTVRWVENCKSLQTAIDILVFVDKYIKGVEKSPPDSRSYRCVKEALKDPLLKGKLEFLHSVANELEPFLVKFQSPHPMLPLLHHELTALLRNIGDRFIKRSILEGSKTSADLLALDVSNLNNLLPVANVSLGFGATAVIKNQLSVKGCKEADVLLFRKQCRDFLSKLYTKLCEKSPLKYKMVRGASCFSPRVMSGTENLRKSRVSAALEEFVEKKHISPGCTDKIKNIYMDLCYSEHESLKNWRDQRLDTFLTEVCKKSGITDEYFFIFMHKILIMYHGNASVERGFSVNKEMLQVGLEEKSLIAQRLIFDAIEFAGPRGLLDMEITKKMIHAARSSSSRRREALDEKRKQQGASAESKKKLEKDLQELVKQKRMTESLYLDDIQSLDKGIEQLKKKIRN